jgi:hypothetical protein
MTEKDLLKQHLRFQADWCRKLGSPQYATLLELTEQDVEANGPCWRVLQGHGADPLGSVPALRFLGAVHRLVLEEKAQWTPFLETVETHAATLRQAMDRPVQTNEVQRCAALIGGFLIAAAETGLPLRTLEVGASAGLNLRWDHYRYESAWGNPQSPVHFKDVYSGKMPPFSIPARIMERRGCDRDPVDPCSLDGQLTLLSYTWPDQPDRLARLRGAFQIAQRVPAIVDRAGAVEWLPGWLAERRDGLTTVVFHSIVMQYMPPEQRTEMRAILEDAGARASAGAPLAWLRMEPGGDQTEVSLTMWPGGRERVLARSGFHGYPVEWIHE